MAFNTSSLDPKYLDVFGVQPKILHGCVALSGGTATVTLKPGLVVISAFASSQTSNAARVSATSANTLTLSGTSADVVDWLAIVK